MKGGPAICRINNIQERKNALRCGLMVPGTTLFAQWKDSLFASFPLVVLTWQVTGETLKTAKRNQMNLKSKTVRLDVQPR